MTVWYALGAVLLAFAAFGAYRGWLREVATLGGLLLTWSIVLVIGRALVQLVDRLYLMATFTLWGGFDARSPDALIETLRRNPLVNPSHPEVVFAVLFLLLAVVSIAAPQRYVAPARSLRGRILGAFVGLTNGYLAVYLALRFLAPGLGLKVASLEGIGGVTTLLERNLTTLLIVGVVLIVGLALMSSTRGTPSRGSTRGAARARGRPGEA